MYKKIVKSILSFTTLAGVLAITCLAAINSKDLDINTLKRSNAIANENINSQSYVTEQGSTNTIYWLQGLSDMPKMTSDKALMGKDGYFNIENSAGTYSYEKEYEYGHGYYDLNKNEQRRKSFNDINHPEFGALSENSLCYLAAAGNLLYWWFNQNSDYINRYVERIQEQTIVQEPGLIDISNPNLFKELGKEPQLQHVDGFDRQELFYSNMVYPTFGFHFEKREGFYSDKVWDFFFNGYPGREGNAVNQENAYVKDSRGGYFFPIFGKGMLSTRTNTSSYQVLSDSLKQYINTGHGVALYYYVSKNDNSHALTLWGAEYDDNGMLKRVYVTDSDDNSYNIANKSTLKGVFGLDVHVDDQGMAHLGNNANAYKNHLVVNGFSTLSLEQEQFANILNDVSPVQKPKINVQPEDHSYSSSSFGDVKPLTVEASIADTGELSYQWYEAKNLNEAGLKLNGETKASLTPNISNLNNNESKYYYCEVTNTKQGQTASIKTRYAKISIDSSLIDTAKPIIHSVNVPSAYNKIITQYSNPGVVYVNASAPDNGTLTYQWYRGTSYYDQNPTFKIEGQTNPYLIVDTTIDFDTKYSCQITNTNINATGNQTYVVSTTPFKVKIAENGQKFNAAKPYIITNPIDASYAKNHIANELVAVSATGDGGNLTYQWYKANSNDINDLGVLIPNATSSTYIPETATVGKAYYYCRITNENSKATGLKTAYQDTAKAEISVTGQVGPDLNKLKAFNDMFLNTVTCDGLGHMTGSNNAWNTMKVEFDKLSSQEKDYLKTASYNDEYVGQTIERYTYIISKYGEDKFDNFINRNITEMANNNCNPVIDNNDLWIFILTAGSIALISCAVISLTIYKGKRR